LCSKTLYKTKTKKIFLIIPKYELKDNNELYENKILNKKNNLNKIK
jgi:hypothetical protein